MAGEQTFQGWGSHLLFANRQTLRLNEAYPLERLGIAFKPGTLYAWWGPRGDASRVIGDADLSRISGLERIKPSWLLGSAATPDTVVSYLDNILSPLMASARLDPAFQLARLAMAHLDARYDNSSQVAESFGTHAQLADRLGCSKRTLERAMTRVTGLTLSQYKTILTLNGLLVYTYRRSEQEIDWTAIAQSFGFSDQPHLIRRLKRLIGSTPGEYLRRRNVLIDVYGDFDATSR
ncbi:helix-turn-helix transcriptional regulator [Halomonas sp. ML-15]|uniref:helix-turn-helix domain-containing protein n=1 Tax=Halomonas sp. ML-15 TaxID=2773305 RepID=UPI00174617D6|nr:AraC family transcriptional regulator [Halomonas sp. ML-15]MBD3895833.1 helix-turn-helix transcriptional regulator [Halomonas sp. ML-15]